MSSAVARAAAELPALRSLVGSGASAKAAELITKLKILMTEFPSQSGASVAPPTGEEVSVAREILELALLSCVRTGDMRSFERNFAQLRVYYQATVAAGSSVSAEVASGRQHVIGLFLTHLLVENRLAEFHSEVELLQPGDREAAFVAFPLALETFLAEGNYGKIISSRSEVPSEHHLSFVDRLVDTARDDIADCASVSYKSLTVAAAQKLMLFDSPAALSAYIAKKQPAWRVSGGVIHFAASEKARPEVEPVSLLSNVLGYATELERIV